ncbi:MAG: ASCH domain-containing protein [Bacteroidales bacterium]|nr:ASCH domain-containing protein [Clostridium sp.]MCM1204734.1 ASCH domain-containing protein [Bacteroidales bacterium]
MCWHGKNFPKHIQEGKAERSELEKHLEELLKTAKPILFNTDMVQAILDGRKTVTRRKIDIDIVNQFDVEHDRKTVSAYINPKTGDCFSPTEVCRYRPGDILYVRETWSMQQSNECIGNATGRCPYDSCETASGSCFGDEYIYKATDSLASSVRKWHPSIHMPKEAARIFLKVTDVRVEKLQDITEEQALKEGVKPGKRSYYQSTAKDIFSGIWQVTIKEQDIRYYGWNANPWVWVIEFEQYNMNNYSG